LSDDNLEIDELEETEAPAQKEPPKQKSTEPRPSFFSRLGQRITAPIAERAQRTSWDVLNWRLAVIGGVVILLVWLLLANLSPVRIVLWLWVVDIPKAVAFVLDVALGALLMWLWIRYRSGRKSAEKGDESE
jgi:uncharacterized integral membrane protein